MLFYFLKQFVRGIRNYQFFSLINIIGLTTGITCSLLIYLYVDHELEYDQFHENAEDIYRVNQTFIWGEDNNQLFSSTGPAVAEALVAEIPEIKAVTRIHSPGQFILTHTKANGDMVSFEESQLYAVDSNFLQVFTFPLLYGDKNTALLQPNSVILTESTAQKYFGEINPVGKSIELGGSGDTKPYQVTGVAQEPPQNSFINFEVLVSMSSFPRVKSQAWSWIWTTFVTFIQVDNQASMEELQSKVADLPSRYAEGTLQRVMGITFEDYTKGGKEWILHLQPLTDIYLGSSGIYNRINTAGDRSVVNTLIAAALFILLMSCINYINLKTALYTTSAKESGIRKLLGSTRTMLSLQLFLESFLYILFSIAISILLLYYLIPYFNALTGIIISLSFLLQPNVIFNIILGILLMGLISGSYPALLLSAFKPISIVQGKITTGKKATAIRNVLVVVQFSLSVMLMAATIIVGRQLNYSLNLNPGFTKDNLVAIDRVEWLQSPEGYLNSIIQLPNVQNVSLCTGIPPQVWNGDQFVPEDNQNKSVALNYLKSDANFMETLEFQLVAGRFFRSIEGQDLNSLLINEQAVQALGWNKETAIGKKVKYPSSNQFFEVIGIIRDFNYWSVQSVIEPLAIFHMNSNVYGNPQNYMAVRIQTNPNQVGATLEQLKTEWDKQQPGVSFSYSFVDDNFASGYENTFRFGNILLVFSSLSLLVAALGLLGVVMYVVDQRTKEFCLRKIMGSNGYQIINLVSKRFLLLIITSIVISVPFTYWLMGKWLNGFLKHIEIGYFEFLISGIIAVGFTIGIIAYRVIISYNQNPGLILRNE